MRRLIVTAVVLAFSLGVAGTGSALAAPCKDLKGRFMKCPPPAPVMVVRCKDAHGKFMKCGLPGARPA